MPERRNAGTEENHGRAAAKAAVYLGTEIPAQQVGAALAEAAARIAEQPS